MTERWEVALLAFALGVLIGVWLTLVLDRVLPP